mmetsp:Transcript_15120/g.24588  ORF Transcript_15120/g.24588 Transcript_15120/m.24588 type:complete len:237 (+) Transcript_15120:27-737(+)
MTMTMRNLATILLVASTTDAFAPPTTSTTTSTTALNHINTRHRIEDQELGIWPTSCRDKSGAYVPCDAMNGHERRATWETYAPEHGTPTNVGAIGCPGGGDWCYASSYGAATPMSVQTDMKKRAANVAAALAGLGVGVGGATDGVGQSIGAGATASGAPVVPSASSSDSSVMGEDVREARMSYAPFTHDGRVGMVGEIGSSGSGGGGGPAPAQVAMPSRKQVGSTSKSYGLGSWKK